VGENSPHDLTILGVSIGLIAAKEKPHPSAEPTASIRSAQDVRAVVLREIEQVTVAGQVEREDFARLGSTTSTLCMPSRRVVDWSVRPRPRPMISTERGASV
jgi:hypothetical protein